MCLALGGYSPSEDTLMRREVSALWASPQRAQMVWHGVEETSPGQLLQLVAECGGGDTAEVGQLVHGGQGRGAQQQVRLLKTLAQGT